MINAFKASTLTRLHDRLTERLVNAPREDLDLVTSVDVQLHNTMSYTPSMEWEFDLKDLWLTPSRWTKMVREYVADIDGSTGKPMPQAIALEEWIEKAAGIGVKKRGIAVFRTNLVTPKGGPQVSKGSKMVRKWGSCMLALSYKAKPTPQITLYSRTSYLGYLSALDLSVAWVAARHIANEIGIGVEDIAFVWVNENLQFHHFKSLAYLLNHSDETRQEYYRNIILARDDELGADGWSDKSFKTLPPALIGSRKWMQNLLKQDDEKVMYGEMSYNTYRRVRRRFHTEVLGYDYALRFAGAEHDRYGNDASHCRAYKPLPHTYASDLDFSKIGITPNWKD